MILTAETFRMAGHATHDEKEARKVMPAGEFTRWGARDPIGLYEEYLKENGVPGAELQSIEQEIMGEIERAEQEALASRDKLQPEGRTALDDVYSSV